MNAGTMRIKFGTLGLRRGLFNRELHNWTVLVEKLNSIQLGKGWTKSSGPLKDLEYTQASQPFEL